MTLNRCTAQACIKTINEEVTIVLIGVAFSSCVAAMLFQSQGNEKTTRLVKSEICFSKFKRLYTIKRNFKHDDFDFESKFALFERRRSTSSLLWSVYFST